MAGFLLQATIYLAAAVVAVPIAKQLGAGLGPWIPDRGRCHWTYSGPCRL